MDILQQYASRATDTHQDFDEVAGQVPKDVLGDGLSHALRSDRTPPFGDMVGQLFGNSNAEQRAGLLTQLIRAIGPGALAGLAGGVLGRLGQSAGSGRAEVSPTDAQSISPEQAREIAAAAEKKDPSVLDKVGTYYAQHPEVMKVLGGAALAIALGQMATRMKR